MTPSVLRRSTRKCSIPSKFNSVYSSPPSKKTRKNPLCPQPSPPTLLSLPYCAISNILLCLDVDSLENLSSTCYYFDQLIGGRFLLSVDLPFPVSFLHELDRGNTIEKKPLLRLRCNKSTEEFNINEFSFMNTSQHKLMAASQHIRDYLIKSQVSLLSLHKVREVDLAPTGKLGNRLMAFEDNIEYYTKFDRSLLKQICRQGSLSHVTKLAVMVDHNLYLEEFMPNLPNLLELGLMICIKYHYSKQLYRKKYLPRLEALVAASKAPILKVTVVQEPERNLNKVFKNNFVEKITVSGPCTFNIFLVMGKLREVVVNVQDHDHPADKCTFWNSKEDDRSLHRAGLCCVNIGAVYENCPKLEKFMGVEVSSISHNQSFNKWNTKIKKKFHKYYLKQGGSLEMKSWAKTRWFSKRVVLPKDIGHNRIV